MGSLGEQLGLGIGGVGELVASLTNLAVGVQQPVHRALRAQIAPFVEQRGIHLRRRAVCEPLSVQHREHRHALGSDNALGGAGRGVGAAGGAGRRRR